MRRVIPPLSVLDSIAIGPGITANQALQWTTQIAVVAEQLGYQRLWVVEHHGVPDIGCGSPAIMIAHLASVTRRIRLGSGGVMLPNHAPLVVAEEFSMLQGLYPNRIDLGVGRASGTDPATAIALRREAASDERFAQQLSELSSFLKREFPSGHHYEKVKIPLEVVPPPIYLLGSSESSAHLAALYGLPYVFAHHLNPEATSSALAVYRKEFQRRGALKEPYAIVTVAAVCAPSKEEAEQSAIGASIVRVRRGVALQHGIDVSPDVLLYPSWSDEELRVAEKALSGGWILVGAPEQLMVGLMNLYQITEADELMLTTIEYDGAERIRTLKAISNAYYLTNSLIS
ncbi:MAG: LLM class flavin-dependent oxidoreductase [Leptolyngbyaceae cyanobacterium RM1_405_57]|nr:LLM class flavin-dependent oxidoreductase [Leptolyngbyaceae cyanobacterium RM1_405_57]